MRAAYSLALDESTDMSDTDRLVIFIRAVAVGSDHVKEFLDMASLSSTTTGQDIHKHVIRVVERIELNYVVSQQMVLPMTVRTNGFTKKSMDAVGAQNVVVCHCIFHQENLCTKVLAFAEIIKNAIQCVNYIRTGGLNHWQFKAFPEYLDCDYPDVVHYSVVCWLSRVATL